jgi:hypothetical protein
MHHTRLYYFSPIHPLFTSTFPPHTHTFTNMSDREGFGGDDEHTLPKATVFKLIGGE